MCGYSWHEMHTTQCLRFEPAILSLPLLLDGEYPPYVIPNTAIHNYNTGMECEDIRRARVYVCIKWSEMADRAAKEEFVSGLSGTSLWEVSLVTLSLAGGYLVLRCSVVCVPAVRRATLHSQL